MEKTTIGSLIEQRSYDNPFTLVTLDDKDTIQDALRKFTGHKVLSAPVHCQKPDPNEAQLTSYGRDSASLSPRNYKMLDLMDIAIALVEHRENQNVLKMPIHSFCNTSRLNPFIPIMSDALVSEALNILSIGAHRIVVLDQATDKPMGIVSQMDILRWAVEHPEWIPEQVRRTPVSSIANLNNKIATVNLNDSIIDALQKFVANRYSGAAVVDSKGALISNISISDLRVLSENNLEILNSTVEEFLTKVKKFPMNKPPVTCTGNTSLQEAYTTMVNEHIHRLYITDEKNQPIGILSITDILSRAR